MSDCTKYYTHETCCENCKKRLNCERCGVNHWEEITAKEKLGKELSEIAERTLTREILSRRGN